MLKGKLKTFLGYVFGLIKPKNVEVNAMLEMVNAVTMHPEILIVSEDQGKQYCVSVALSILTLSKYVKDEDPVNSETIQMIGEYLAKHTDNKTVKEIISHIEDCRFMLNEVVGHYLQGTELTFNDLATHLSLPKAA